MTQAQVWQEREYQRQKLVDGLMEKIYTTEEQSKSETFLFDFSSVLIGNLKKRRLGHLFYRSETQFETLFYHNILPAIDQFTSVSEEKDILIAQILERTVNSALFYFKTRLQKKVFDDPEEIFKASSAVVDVESE